MEISKSGDIHYSSVEVKYANADERKKSLEGVENGLQLSLVGAYKDKFHRVNINCYKCGLLFDVDEIRKLSVDFKLSFLKASWLFHAKSRRACTFLQVNNGKTISIKLSQKYRF